MIVIVSRHVGIIRVCARDAALIEGLSRHWQAAVLESRGGISGCWLSLLFRALNLVALCPIICCAGGHLNLYQRLLFAGCARIDDFVLEALGSSS